MAIKNVPRRVQFNSSLTSLGEDGDDRPHRPRRGSNKLPVSKNLPRPMRLAPRNLCSRCHRILRRRQIAKNSGDSSVVHGAVSHHLQSLRPHMHLARHKWPGGRSVSVRFDSQPSVPPRRLVRDDFTPARKDAKAPTRCEELLSSRMLGIHSSTPENHPNP